MGRINLQRQWGHYSDTPRIALSNAHDSTALGAFQEVHYGEGGDWDVENLHHHFAELVTPAVHIDGTGRRAVSRRVVPSSAIAAPGSELVGGWRGRMIGYHLFVTPQDAGRILDFDVTASGFVNRGFRTEDESDGPDDIVRHILRAIRRELKSDMPSGHEFMDHLVCALIHHAARPPGAAMAVAGRAGSRPDRGILRSIETIRGHLGQRLPLVELATAAGYSVSYYCQKFKELTGETPHQFILRERVEMAKKFLLRDDLAIVDVALKSGFTDQSQFTTVFRKFTGTTPARFRNHRGRA